MLGFLTSSPGSQGKVVHWNIPTSQLQDKIKNNALENPYIGMQSMIYGDGPFVGNDNIKNDNIMTHPGGRFPEVYLAEKRRLSLMLSA